MRKFASCEECCSLFGSCDMICLNCTRRSTFDTRVKFRPLQRSHECPAAPVFCRRVELRTPLYVSAVTTCCQNTRNDIGTRISILISIVGTDSLEKLFCVGCTFARRKLFDGRDAFALSTCTFLVQPAVALNQPVGLRLLRRGVARHACSCSCSSQMRFSRPDRTSLRPCSDRR